MLTGLRSITFLYVLVFQVMTVDLMAASQKLSVNVVIGDVTFQRGKKKPKTVRKTTRLKIGDLIKTAIESRLEIRLKNGSTFTIEEESEVELTMFAKDGKLTKSKLNIKVGKVLFNIKKLASTRSEFVFETPTATAAIRGTKGAIGYYKSQVYAYLETGSMELDPTGVGNSVLLGELSLAYQTSSGFKVESKKDLEELFKSISKIEKELKPISTVKKEKKEKEKKKKKKKKKESSLKASPIPDKEESTKEINTEENPDQNIDINVPYEEDSETNNHSEEAITDDEAAGFDLEPPEIVDIPPEVIKEKELEEKISSPSKPSEIR